MPDFQLWSFFLGMLTTVVVLVIIIPVAMFIAGLAYLKD